MGFIKPAQSPRSMRQRARSVDVSRNSKFGINNAGEMSRPSYFFTIQPMYSRRDVQVRVTSRGTWLPFKSYGKNIPTGTRLSFYHDGTITTQGLFNTPNETAFKTFSIYYNRGKIWTVRLDATSSQVGDGIDYSAASGRRASGAHNSNSGASSNYDWENLSFQDRGNSVSFAGQRLPLEGPTARRPDQVWPDLLLPDAYHAIREEHDRNRGGLIGELPLLLGLVALTLPPAYVASSLPELIQHTWRVSNDFRRGVGWDSPRGLVVTVYVDPGRSSVQQLRHLEQGRYGTILP